MDRPVEQKRKSINNKSMCRTLVCSEVGMSNDLIKDKHFNKSCAGMTGFAIWKN